MTFASWYQRDNWHGKPMRISRLAGRGLKKAIHNWGEVRCLIPDWELVKAYRSGKISQEQYTSEYARVLEDRWSEVSDWLSSLRLEEDFTLLCHEKEGEFCHRRLVADLVRVHRPDIQIDLR